MGMLTDLHGVDPVSLLHLKCLILQNFEALMELTNLMGVSEQLW